MMPFYIVDVFANGRYTGNQLAVIRGNPDASTMQQLALEMHYSETTFITSDTPRDGGYDTRIFTPKSELPFAGHPTLGTAFIIQQELRDGNAGQVNLNVQVGQIPVTFQGEFAWMRQNPPEFGGIFDVQATANVLNLNVDDIDTRYPIQAVSTGLPWVIVPLRTLDAVKRAEVDLKAFKQLLADTDDPLNADVMLIFAPEAENAENDIHARGFAHLHGVPEDPATGSANGDLAGYLVKHRYLGSDSVDVRVEQGYEINRPSLLLLRAMETDGEIEINVGGRVNMVARGELV